MPVLVRVAALVSRNISFGKIITSKQLKFRETSTLQQCEN